MKNKKCLQAFESIAAPDKKTLTSLDDETRLAAKIDRDLKDAFEVMLSDSKDNNHLATMTIVTHEHPNAEELEQDSLDVAKPVRDSIAPCTAVSEHETK